MAQTVTVEEILQDIGVTQSGAWTVGQGGAPWSVSQSGTWDIATLTTLTGITNTVTVDGTVTANQGGSPWAVSQSGTWDVGTVTSVTEVVKSVVWLNDEAGAPFTNANPLPGALSDGTTQAAVDATKAALLVGAHIVDDSGVLQGIKVSEGMAHVLSMPYGYAIAEGDLSGHSAVHKFGYNGDIDAVLEPIWTSGGNYPYLSAGEQLKVSGGANDVSTLRDSGNATGGSTTTIEDTGADFVAATVAVGDVVINDTQSEYGIICLVEATKLTVYTAMSTGFSAADAYRVLNASGTGAAAVRVLGLDDDYLEISEVVATNGAAPVATSQSFLRVFRAYVVIAGNTGGNVAAILVQDNAAAVTQAEIRATRNQTEMAIWTVPASKTLFLTATHAGESNNVRAEVSVFQRPRGGVFRPIGLAMAVKQGGDGHDYATPLSIPQKTDVEMRAIGDGVNAAVSAGFEGWYE